MKRNIHPNSYKLTVKCSKCGSAFDTVSTLQQGTYYQERCMNEDCHPFYAGFSAASTQKSDSKKQSTSKTFSISDLT